RPGHPQFATSDKVGVTLWDARTGQRMLHHEGWGRVTFRFDGRLLATVGKDHVQVHEVDSGKSVLAVPHPGCRVVAFHPSGRELAVAGVGNEVVTYDFPAGKRRTGFGFRSEVSELRYSPDGKQLAAAGNGHGRVWNLGKGEAKDVKA